MSRSKRISASGEAAARGVAVFAGSAAIRDLDGGGDFCLAGWPRRARGGLAGDGARRDFCELLLDMARFLTSVQLLCPRRLSSGGGTSLRYSPLCSSSFATSPVQPVW